MRRPSPAPSASPALPRRRLVRVVGGASLAALAGCLASPPGAASCADRTELALVEATEAHVSNEFSTPVDGLSHAARAVVTDALSPGDDDATVRGYYAPEVPTAYVVTGSGSGERYYSVEVTHSHRAETTGYEYAVERVDRSAVPDESRVRSFASLPAPDRESIRSAVGRETLLRAPHYSLSVVFAYERDETAASVFVPDAEVRYVAWNGTVLRFDLATRRPVRIATARVTTDPVAESPAAFVRHVGGERGVVLDDLTGRQRDVVTGATDSAGYAECGPHSDPFAALLERLSTGDGVAPLARYRGVWYFVDVSR